MEEHRRKSLHPSGHDVAVTDSVAPPSERVGQAHAFLNKSVGFQQKQRGKDREGSVACQQSGRDCDRASSR